MPTGRSRKSKVHIVVYSLSGNYLTIAGTKEEFQTWTVLQLKKTMREHMLRARRRHEAVALVPALFNLFHCGHLLLRHTLVREHINLNTKRVELWMVTRVRVRFDSDGDPIPQLCRSDDSDGHDSVEDGDEAAVKQTSAAYCDCDDCQRHGKKMSVDNGTAIMICANSC